jgi:NADPH-dependent 2,4-dienoyl-CoA reductase/sulfur reductase-like enzyme
MPLTAVFPLAAWADPAAAARRLVHVTRSSLALRAPTLKRTFGKYICIGKPKRRAGTPRAAASVDSLGSRAVPREGSSLPYGDIKDRSQTCDVVIIGSGIGGLCCGALLARYGLDVVVCESHYLPGA